MKKTLIALAAVAATGVAFAQSSVTLYGVADAGIGQTGAVEGVDNDTSFLGSSKMNNGNSRWGIRGTEDLGGGLKASFNFEQGINIADGTLSQSGPGPFSRAAWMALSGGFGEVRLGRTLNPSFFAAAAWELTGAANYSVVVNQFAPVLGGIRNSSQFQYTSPNMGGVTATLGYILEENNGGDAKVDLNVLYRGGPLAVGLGYNKVSGAEKNWHIGANYNFGAFRVAGAWIDPAGASKGFSIGAGTTVGPVSLVLDIARDTDADDTDLLIEAKYPLSKRTFAYLAFLRDDDAKIGATASENNFGLGIRHNF